MTALHRVTTRGDVAPWQAPTTLAAALDWLIQTQDGTGERAGAPHYSLIPTLYLAAWHLERPELARRAERVARQAVELQLSSGAVWGGVVRTGQALLGWLSAFAETGSGVCAGAARRAGRFLVATLDPDGVWRRDGAYSPHTAWALAEAGRRLGAPELRAAAANHLRAVVRLRHDDGWMPDARFSDRPRALSDIADAIRGLLESGRVLGDERLIALAAQAAEAVAAAQGADARLPDRFAPGWRPAGPSDSGVGQAHMANVWLRCYEITGARVWLGPVRPALRVLTSTLQREEGEGAISAMKFLIDALIREERIARGWVGETTAALA